MTLTRSLEAEGMKMTGDTATAPRSLGEALPAEMARVRDHVMPAYIEIGPAGAFGLMMMRQSLDAATKALAEGDVVQMLVSYEDLKGYKL